MSSSSKQSSKQSSVPFVPSPRYLESSPGQPSSSGASNSPWRQRYIHGQPDELLSPIPPPPANLYSDSPAAFNVDPGVPFLATAGSSDVPDSEEISEDESSTRKKFVGNLVSNIRNTVRRSLRRRRRDTWTETVFPDEQQEIWDSGYGSELVAPGPGSTEAQTSHEQGIRQGVPAQHYTAPYYSTYSNYPKFDVFDNYRNDLDVVSLFSGSVSAETASIPKGSDYRKMEAPHGTDESLGAYIKRTKQFIHQISALPFTSRTRVTYDYYPERDLRDDPRRRPFIEWHRRGYGPTNYSPVDDNTPAVFPHEIPFEEQNTAPYASHQVPAVELDLREEFDDTAPVPTLPNANPAPPQPQPVQIVYGAPVTFQPIPTKRPSQRHTLSEAPEDHSWDEALSANRKRRMAAPFHHAASIDAPATHYVGGWQQYPHYRDGYVPPELAETHYGSQYGPGVHSARAGLAPLGSRQSSTPRKRHQA